jgi:hypothetical protein
MLGDAPISLDTKIWPLIKERVNLINHRNLPKLEKITLLENSFFTLMLEYLQ